MKRTAVLLTLLLAAAAVAGTGVHTTYLWHMHQPVYWPAESTWAPGRYELAYETISLGHSQNDEVEIFSKPDRVADYQWYPKDAVSSISDLPEAGAQVSFAGALIENLTSLGDAGWNGGLYASDWWSHYRTARGWLNTAGDPRLDPVLVGFHHAIGPLMPESAFRMELATAREIYADAWGGGPQSTGFFPAEMCFSERLIPALVDAGVTWSIVPDLHIARACADYPWNASLDNTDAPNPADQVNPPQANWTSHTISRGVTLKVPYPYGFTPHRAVHVDPATGQGDTLVVVPAANAMGWEEGYGLFGTGGIDQMAWANDPARPMLVLFAHDGDNAWSGGDSYYHQNVPGFSHAAAAQGYTPTTVATYLRHHPVPHHDVVHVEDGGWVNADGDFGSPQYINWNWPLVDQAGDFDIPGGWAEDERNWAVLMAAQNRVETACAVLPAVDPAKVLDPLSGAHAGERAWHFLLAGYESGYMYYGASLDMEIKATLACNKAAELVDPVLSGAEDLVGPTVWLPQRLPWNPGGSGGGALWGYPGGTGAPMPSDFHVWTFVHDVSGLARIELKVRTDADGANDPATTVNETYAGGAGVSAWTSLSMTLRAMPQGEPWPLNEIDFTVLPTHIADQAWVEVAGYENVLLDYYVEAEDQNGLITRSPIQHVWVGESNVIAPSDVVWTDPDTLQAAAPAAVWYDPAGRVLDGAPAVLLHWGVNGWTGVTDTPMTWNADSLAWRADIAVPSHATVLDLVFTDGLGTWDNNGGADWHLPVGGGVSEESPFVMDGQLDASASQTATCGGGSLWVDLQDPWLYVATDGVSAWPSQDVFILLGAADGAAVSAPWVKAGQVRAWDAYLAAEGSNTWSGWFDQTETTPPAFRTEQARGAVLEGVVHLDDLYPAARPLELIAAVAAYVSPAGGALYAQAPCGDGDGDLLSAADFVPVWVPVAVADDAPRAFRATAAPNPFNGRTEIRLAGLREDARTDMAVYDASGRLVRRLDVSSAGGMASVSWDGRDDGGRALPSGIYFVRAAQGARTATVRVSYVK
ncbi:T9SS type A sorting domain-containing protein [bacterium]|nr:T9SS type A sorting domain-containing protein [bacterium]